MESVRGLGLVLASVHPSADALSVVTTRWVWVLRCGEIPVGFNGYLDRSIRMAGI